MRDGTLLNHSTQSIVLWRGDLGRVRFDVDATDAVGFNHVSDYSYFDLWIDADCRSGFATGNFDGQGEWQDDSAATRLDVGFFSVCGGFEIIAQNMGKRYALDYHDHVMCLVAFDEVNDVEGRLFVYRTDGQTWQAIEKGVRRAKSCYVYEPFVYVASPLGDNVDYVALDTRTNNEWTLAAGSDATIVGVDLPRVLVFINDLGGSGPRWRGSLLTYLRPDAATSAWQFAFPPIENALARLDLADGRTFFVGEVDAERAAGHPWVREADGAMRRLSNAWVSDIMVQDQYVIVRHDCRFGELDKAYPDLLGNCRLGLLDGDALVDLGLEKVGYVFRWGNRVAVQVGYEEDRGGAAVAVIDLAEHTSLEMPFRRNSNPVFDSMGPDLFPMWLTARPLKDSKSNGLLRATSESEVETVVEGNVYRQLNDYDGDHVSYFVVAQVAEERQPGRLLLVDARTQLVTQLEAELPHFYDFSVRSAGRAPRCIAFASLDTNTGAVPGVGLDPACVAP